jgi:uncharacterized delta-60 repeat protein
MRLLPSFILVLVLAAPSFAGRPGALDASFGAGGVMLDDATGGGQVLALAVQSDGKILAADYWGIKRYLPDGTIDVLYAGDATFNYPVDTRFPRMAMLAGDAVLVSGTGYGAVIKVLADGTLDPAFGTGGIATAAPVTDTGEVVVQPDGKILLAGKVPGPGNPGLTVARLNDDGSVDTAFGTNGVATVSPSATLNTVALQPVGKIIAAGSLVVPFEGRNFALARFDTDGQLDATFGSGGTVTTDTQSGGTDTLYRLVVQGDDVVAVGQTIKSGQYWFTLVRYVDGVVDPTFGVSGITQVNTDEVSVGVSGELPLDAVLDADGNVIVTGHSLEPGATTMRFDPDGTLDPVFGAGGVAWLPEESLDIAVSYATTLDAEGRILIGAAGIIDELPVFAVARYFGGGSSLPRCAPTRDLTCTDVPVGGKASFQVKNKTKDKSDKLKWQWKAPIGSTLGDPVTTESYALCIYRDGMASSPPLRYSAAVPPGGTCRNKPCWNAVKNGFRYTDGKDSAQGVKSITLQQDGSKTKIVFQGAGVNLGGMNILPLGLPVHVQLQASNGECWNTTFTAPKKNDGGQFQGQLKP